MLILNRDMARHAMKWILLITFPLVRKEPERLISPCVFVVSLIQSSPYSSHLYPLISLFLISSCIQSNTLQCCFQDYIG